MKEGLTSFKEKRDAFLSSAASDCISVFIFKRNGCVRVCSREITLLLDAAVHCLQPLCSSLQPFNNTIYEKFLGRHHIISVIWYVH